MKTFSLMAMVLMSIIACEPTHNNMGMDLTSIEVKSAYGGGKRTNMVETHFKNALEEDSKVKRMHDNYFQKKKSLQELTSQFNAYNNRQLVLYNDLPGYYKLFTDQELKTEMTQLGNASKIEYQELIQDHKKLSDGINQELKVLQQEYRAIKLIVAIKQAEKVQKAELMDIEELKEAKAELDKLKKELDHKAWL